MSKSFVMNQQNITVLFVNSDIAAKGSVTTEKTEFSQRLDNTHDISGGG